MSTSLPNRSHPDLPNPDLPGLLPALLLAEQRADGGNGVVRRSARDWFVDVLCFVFATVIGIVAFLEAVSQSGLTTLRIADLVAGSAACLGLWVRRRWPVHLALAVMAVSAFATSSGGAVLITTFTVAVHRRFPIATAIAAGHILITPIYNSINPPLDLSIATAFVINTLIVVAVLVWGMFIRARRQLVLSLRERARQAESEAHLRVEQARQRERRRIAREMHDVLAHRLSLVSVHANALAYRPDASADDVARASDIIRESAHQALQDLREVIGVLRAPSADDVSTEPEPTLDELSALIDESRQAGMRVDLADARPAGAALPSAVSRCAYRLVQEGLTNARKHAAGATVSARLAGSPRGDLTVEVHNDPPGPASSSPPSIPGAGTGLVGLDERVSLAGGKLSYGPAPSGGYTLSARLPWPG